MPVYGDPSEPLALFIVVLGGIGLAWYLYDGIRSGKRW